MTRAESDPYRLDPGSDRKHPDTDETGTTGR